MNGPDGHPEVTRLRARVAALEEALERRSAQLCRLQSLLEPDQVLAAASGHDPADPVARYYSLSWWNAGTGFVSRDVEPALADLWAASPGPSR